MAGADEFPMVLPRLRAQIGGRVILGYKMGFDLAVLEAEAERHGVDWSWSAALCLRELATCLLGTKTMMMFGDLEALAARDDIPPKVGRLGEDVAVVLRLVLRQQIAGNVGRLDTLLKDKLFG